MVNQEKNRLRVLIVDDERPARELLHELLKGEDAFEVVGEAEDGRKCLKMVRVLRPDLIFLDVQMPGSDGFDMLAKLSEAETPFIVFVTAFNQFAVRAFEYHALDYLLKPFKKSRFKKCLEHVKKELLGSTQNKQKPRLRRLLEYYQLHKSDIKDELPEKVHYLQRVFVDSKQGSKSIEVDKIDYIEAASQYARIHVGSASYLVSKSLSWFEKELDSRVFARIHRCHMINLSRVISFSSNSGKGSAVTLPDGTILPIARRRVQELGNILSGN